MKNIYGYIKYGSKSLFHKRMSNTDKKTNKMNNIDLKNKTGINLCMTH